MTRALTLKQAQALYVNRYTMEHKPKWAAGRTMDRPEKRFYAPQYRSDAEWYENTLFPGEPGHIGGKNSCYSRNPSWPLGQVLDQPFVVEASK